MTRASESAAPALARVLGPFDATCVVIGAIIGVGIFFNPSRVAQLAGSADLALLAWAAGGVLALLGALTFAELGLLYPSAGGQYEILRDAYGPLPAFLFVFCNATAIQGGAIAVIALVCADNVGVAVTGAVPAVLARNVIAATLILLLCAANVVGVRWGAGVQNFTVLAKLATLTAIILLAALLAPQRPDEAAHAAPLASRPAWTVFLAAVLPACFAYGGWQHALWMAGEVRSPRRNVPLAILLGTGIVIAAYLLANWAYLHLLGFTAAKTTPALAADAVAVAWPQSGRRLSAAAVAFSAFGVLNAQLLSGPRLVYRMAADGRFFRLFSRVPARFGTPAPAVLLLAGMGLALMLAAGQSGVDALTTGIVFVDACFFALTGAALLILRRRHPPADRTGAFGYPLVPVLFVLAELGIVLGGFSDPDNWRAALVGASWIVGAALFYAVFFRGGGRSIPPGTIRHSRGSG